MSRRSLLFACVFTAALLVTGCSPAAHLTMEPPASCKELKPQDSAVVAWLGKQALPLQSVEPGTDLKDLTRLKANLKGVQLVGMGEATHGTREFSTAKHRLLQYLVQEMGVRTLLWEMNYGGIRQVEEYIQGSGSEIRNAFRSMYGIWATDEVADMVNWMRTYNLSVPPQQRIHVIGFDVQEAVLPAQEVSQYLQKTAPGFFPGVSDALLYVQRTTFASAQPFMEGTTQRLTALRSIGTYLTEHQAELIAASSAQEFQQALLEAHIVARYYELEFATVQTDVNELRDRLMADTVLEIMGRGGPAALWAHDAHISTDARKMGAYLRGALGDKYYALAITTGQGDVTAIGIKKDGTTGSLATYMLDDASAGQVEWYFACAGLGNSYVNLRGKRGPDEVAGWLKEPREKLILGWGFPVDGQFGFTNPLPPGSFDGMVYIPVSTAARQLR